MREIKFRGKTKDGVWVYGSLLQSEIDVNQLAVKCEIHERFAHDFSIAKHEVDPKSVGEWIGLKDKKGKEVFEGDVVRGLLIHPTSTTGTLPTMGSVEYCKGYAAFCLKNEAGQTLFHNHLINSFEVIGNIYEHPELLK